MIKNQVSEVLERVRAWPEARREEAARILIEMKAQDASPIRLSDEQLAEVRRRASQPKSGTGIARRRTEKVQSPWCMRVVFDEEALDDLQSIFAWVAKDDPAAAAGLINPIFEKMERLTGPELTRMGRFGRDAGTHELLEGSYIIVYEIDERRGEIRVISVVHGARGTGS
jgi:plasmid stabilization system protein ParE